MTKKPKIRRLDFGKLPAALPIRLKLRTKLALWLALAGLVPLIAVSTFSLKNATDRLHDTIHEATSRSLQIAMNLILRQVQQTASDAGRLARASDIQKLFEKGGVRPARMSAKRVLELAEEMGLEVRERMLLVNRVGEGNEPLGREALDEVVQKELDRLELDLFAAIPPDPAVVQADLDQASLLNVPLDSPAARAADKVVDAFVKGK